jgi:tRNA (guanine6-N2)-methyltransferase
VSLYYSTFIPGLQRPVEEALRSALPDSVIALSLDGLITFESSASLENIRTLPFVTNTFLVFKQGSGSVADMAAALLNDATLSLDAAGALARKRTFRIIPSVANQLVSLDDHLLQALENLVARKTGLRPHRSKPDVEFWLLERSEGYGFFSLRISHHKAYDKILEKGELRPELAYLLNWLSSPAPGELFLDPFCGSGAIPLQRARYFPTGLVIASDKDERHVQALKEKVKELGFKKRMVVRMDDALHLHRYEAGSIHKIVTDPPWGQFEETARPIESIYTDMLREFRRVLRPGGVAVVLTAATGAFDTALTQAHGFSVSARYNILVSGKKASVYVLQG